MILLVLLTTSICPPVASASQPGLEERVEAVERGLEAVRDEMRAFREELRVLVEALRSGEEEGTSSRLEDVERRATEIAIQQDELEAETETTFEEIARADERRPTVSVYGTFNTIWFEEEDSVFDAEAFELVFSGKPHERLGFFAEIELERAAAVGSGRGGEVLIEQAYATYSLHPAVNLRAGVVLVPFGNTNLDHYAPVRDVVTRPLVSQVVAPGDWTDNGLGLTGRFTSGGLWSVDYEAYLVAGLGEGITARGAREARQPFGEDNNDDKAFVGRVAAQRLGLELGLSFYTGDYDDAGRHRLEGWALDGAWRSGPWLLGGEWSRFRGEGSPVRILEGGYLRGVRDLGIEALTKGWHGRLFPTARVSLVAQVDRARIMGPWEGSTETNVEERWTLGLNYRPSHHWVAKMHWEQNSVRGRALARGDSRGILTSIGFRF